MVSVKVRTEKLNYPLVYVRTKPTWAGLMADAPTTAKVAT
jgi:hypothetical protein